MTNKAVTSLAVFFLTGLLVQSAFATFKAGEFYALKKTVVFQKVVGSQPEKVSEAKGPATEPSPYVAFWSLNKKRFEKTSQIAPGLCEIRIVQTASTETEISIKKDSLFKVSSPMKAEDANIQTIKNCLVMDAISEDGGAAEKPQMQFTCCSVKPLPTPASMQDFNEEMQKGLKSLLKLQVGK